jgi:hypothetical protein
VDHRVLVLPCKGNPVVTLLRAGWTALSGQASLINTSFPRAAQPFGLDVVFGQTLAIKGAAM